MAESRFPPEAGAMLRGVETAENPWGQPASARTDWTATSTSGCCSPATRRPSSCSGSAAPARSTNARKKTTQSVARLLNAAGVDFAVLGPRERCTGDPARRMGHEYLFQMLAEQNVATLNGRAA